MGRHRSDISDGARSMRNILYDRRVSAMGRPLCASRLRARLRKLAHPRAVEAVIDFDATVRDPNHPDTFSASYDHGDHLHLNDVGIKPSTLKARQAKTRI
jgi:hypothetical protein